MLPRGRHGTEIVGLALPELVAAPPIEAPVVEEQRGEPLPEPPTTEFVLVGEHMYTAANLDSAASSQAWLRHGRALDLPSPPAGPPTTHESRASQTGPELRTRSGDTDDRRRGTRPQDVRLRPAAAVCCCSGASAASAAASLW